MNDLAARIGSIETIVQEIETYGDPALQDRVRDLLQAILEVHGTALSRLLEHVYDAYGQDFIDGLAADELIGSVLLLHDLHPQSRTARVLGALEKVKPYLASHGGNVELVELTGDGTVVLRLEGSCHGCPSSQATLKHTIEEAVTAAAPDVRSIAIDERKGRAASSVIGDRNGHLEGPAEFIPMADVQWQECPFPSEGFSSDTTTTTPE